MRCLFSEVNKDTNAIAIKVSDVKATEASDSLGTVASLFLNKYIGYSSLSFLEQIYCCPREGALSLRNQEIDTILRLLYLFQG
jgi:hypothetical protein